MQKTLIVIPRGGLGNRMRVITSALSFSQAFGYRLVFFWQLTAELNCPYEELFQSKQKLKIYNSNRFLSRFQGALCALASKWPSRLIDFYDDVSIDKLVNRTKNLGPQPSNLVVIGVNGSFYDSEWGANPFVPNASLLCTIDEVCRSYSEHTVGVHIRRQDNAHAILHSKTDYFVQEMDRIIDQHNDVKFFLSTDCAETEKMIHGLYGERIIAREKSFNRNERSGVKDALIDMFCLSRTDSIIGSYWSSFSEVASKLGGKPLHIVTSTSRVKS